MYKPKVSMSLVLTFMTVMTVSSSCWPATYYLDATSGDDGNNGLSPSTAWKTIAKVNSSTFEPGDYILFKSGEIWSEPLTIPNSGSEGNHITFAAYGSAAPPIITGADHIARGIVADAKDYFNINNIDLQHFRRDAIRLTSCNHVEIKDCSISYWGAESGGNGIGLNGSTYVVIDSVKLSGNYDVNNHGVALYGDSDNCTVRNCDIGNVFNGVRFNADSGESPQYCTIDSNTIHDIDRGSDSGADGIYFHGNRSVLDCAGTVVQNNHIYNFKDQGIDTIGTQDLTVRYNIVHTSVSGTGDQDGIKLDVAFGTKGMKCYYNIVYHVSGHGIYAGDFEGSFCNNVVYDCGKNGFYISADSSGQMDVRNNIFSNVAKISAYNYCFIYYSSRTPADVMRAQDYNCYYDSGTDGIYFSISGTRYTDWGSYRTSHPQLDAHSMNQRPLFKGAASGDFTLQPSSPCINAGVTLDMPRDISETPVPQGSSVDIGVFEYTGNDDTQRPSAPQYLQLRISE